MFLTLLSDSVFVSLLKIEKEKKDHEEKERRDKRESQERAKNLEEWVNYFLLFFLSSKTRVLIWLGTEIGKNQSVEEV